MSDSLTAVDDGVQSEREDPLDRLLASRPFQAFRGSRDTLASDWRSWGLSLLLAAVIVAMCLVKVAGKLYPRVLVVVGASLFVVPLARYGIYSCVLGRPSDGGEGRVSEAFTVVNAHVVTRALVGAAAAVTMLAALPTANFVYGYLWQESTGRNLWVGEAFWAAVVVSGVVGVVVFHYLQFVDINEFDRGGGLRDGVALVTGNHRIVGLLTAVRLGVYAGTWWTVATLWKVVTTSYPQSGAELRVVIAATFGLIFLVFLAPFAVNTFQVALYRQLADE